MFRFSLLCHIQNKYSVQTNSLAIRKKIQGIVSTTKQSSSFSSAGMSSWSQSNVCSHRAQHITCGLKIIIDFRDHLCSQSCANLTYLYCLHLLPYFPEHRYILYSLSIWGFGFFFLAWIPHFPHFSSSSVSRILEVSEEITNDNSDWLRCANSGG